MLPYCIRLIFCLNHTYFKLMVTNECSVSYKNIVKLSLFCLYDEQNEAMTGTHTQNPIISNITLALMEDTGWYIANYSMAEPMSWGKGLGCDFVMKSCKEWISSKSVK